VFKTSKICSNPKIERPDPQSRQISTEAVELSLASSDIQIPEGAMPEGTDIEYGPEPFDDIATPLTEDMTVAGPVTSFVLNLPEGKVVTRPIPISMQVSGAALELYADVKADGDARRSGMARSRNLLQDGIDDQEEEEEWVDPHTVVAAKLLQHWFNDLEKQWVAIPGGVLNAELGVIEGELPPDVLNHAGYSGKLANLLVTTVDCEPASYADEEGLRTQSCFLCPAGTAGNKQPTAISQAASSCIPCTTGQFQDELGQTMCKQCPPKHNTSAPGQALCTPDLIPPSSIQDLKDAAPMVEMTIVLPINIGAFDSGAQNLLRLAVSEVVGVAGHKVYLLEVDEFSPDGRRQGVSTSVRLAVEADSEQHAQSMVDLLSQDNLNQELNKVGLPDCIVVASPTVTTSEKINCESFSTCDSKIEYLKQKVKKIAGGMAGGAIAGIVIGVLVALAVKLGLYRKFCMKQSSGGKDDANSPVKGDLGFRTDSPSDEGKNRDLDLESGSTVPAAAPPDTARAEQGPAILSQAPVTPAYEKELRHMQEEELLGGSKVFDRPHAQSLVASLPETKNAAKNAAQESL